MERWMALWMLLPGGWLLVQGPGAAEEAPLAGRPIDYSQVVGFFRMHAEAEPTEVCVEDPILLKVTITGQAQAPFLPKRQNLQLFPEELNELFYVEPRPQEDRLDPRKNSWTFAWRLRPKSLQVKYLPSLKLTYYSPRVREYQSTYADAIELTVKPRPAAALSKDAAPVTKHPERMYRIATGDEVLERWSLSYWSGPWIWIGLLGAPPLLCLAWYRHWLAAHPDAAQSHKRRQSQAARDALKALAGKGAADNSAWLETIVTDYLRQRFDFPAHEATPAEVEQHLFRLGIEREIRGQWSAFFGDCADVRFSPSPVEAPEQLRDQAIALIQNLEAER